MDRIDIIKTKIVKLILEKDHLPELPLNNQFTEEIILEVLNKYMTADNFKAEIIYVLSGLLKNEENLPIINAYIPAYSELNTEKEKEDHIGMLNIEFIGLMEEFLSDLIYLPIDKSELKNLIDSINSSELDPEKKKILILYARNIYNAFLHFAIYQTVWKVSDFARNAPEGRYVRGDENEELQLRMALAYTEAVAESERNMTDEQLRTRRQEEIRRRREEARRRRADLVAARVDGRLWREELLRRRVAARLRREDRERRRQRTAVQAGGSSWPVKTYRQSVGGLINSQFINYFLNPILIMRKEFY